MGECPHMASIPVPEPEAHARGRKECPVIGQPYVHLRKCLECGHIGCCDQWIGKHAAKHARVRSSFTGPPTRCPSWAGPPLRATISGGARVRSPHSWSREASRGESRTRGG